MRGIYSSGDEGADPIGLRLLLLHVTLCSTQLFCAGLQQNYFANDKRRAPVDFIDSFGDRNDFCLIVSALKTTVLVQRLVQYIFQQGKSAIALSVYTLKITAERMIMRSVELDYISYISILCIFSFNHIHTFMASILQLLETEA